MPASVKRLLGLAFCLFGVAMALRGVSRGATEIAAYLAACLVFLLGAVLLGLSFTRKSS